MRSGIVGGLKFGRVKLLVQERLPLISEAVQTARDALNQPVLRQRREAVAGVALGCDIEVSNGSGREISLVAHRLKNALVDRAHPVSPLSYHASLLRCETHMSTDMSSYGANTFIVRPYSASNSA